MNLKSVVGIWLVTAILVFSDESGLEDQSQSSATAKLIKGASGDLAGSGLNVHMSFNLRYKGHTISVYESMSNQAATATDTLKFFYVPLMFPIANAASQNWLWKAENGTEIRLSLAVGNGEIERLIHDTIVNKNSTNPAKINVAPMVIKSLTAVVTSVSGDPVPGIHPFRFVNPTQMALIFRFKCTSAQSAEVATMKLLAGDYNIELAFYFAGLHTLSMNIVKITGETIKSVLSSTTAGGGNTMAAYIHRKQGSKFVSQYMANVKKTIYTENPNADTTAMIAGLEDQFKTLMQQAMDSSAKIQLAAKVFDQVWAADDLRPDRVTKELSKLFKENKAETDYRDDGEQYYDYNEAHAQASELALSVSAKGKIPLVGSAEMSTSASEAQSSSDSLGNKTKLVVSKQDIEKYFKKEEIELEWQGEKIIPKSFMVYKLVDITDRLQVALVAKQLIAEKSNGAEMKVFNAMDVPTASVALAVTPLTLTGEIRLYSGESQPPLPWLLCNGTTMSRIEYQRLFLVIGEKYGAGDGKITFNLPDFRGRVPVGVDQLQVRSSHAAVAGAAGGRAVHHLTVEQLPSHQHGRGSLDLTTNGAHSHSVSDPGHTHSIIPYDLQNIRSGVPYPTASYQVDSGDSYYERNDKVNTDRADTNIEIDYAGSHTHRLFGETDSVGKGHEFSLMQPFQAVHYIIYSE